MQTNKSIKAFEASQKLLPGGVNSPVRAFRTVGGQPLFMHKGKGAHVWDIDGNRYIDFCMSWGALMTGHANKKVLQRVRKAMAKGTSFGCPTLNETKLAAMVSGAFLSMEMLRFVSSGTEATMSAIRLARGYTGRKLVVKFDGCYHGHSDSLLVAAGSGVADLQQSSSKGVTEGCIADTISLPFNDIDSFTKTVNAKHHDIACVIMEPVPANMGLVMPLPGFLEKVREITLKHGIVLIFDEVITGFRLAYGGARQIFNIQADITCLGKIIGGGFPVGAFGGKREIMQCLAPLGDVYQAGTLSGNPVAMQAGIATLSALHKKKVYPAIVQMMQHFLSKLKPEVKIISSGAMFWIFFASHKNMTGYEAVKTCDVEKFAKFHQKLLQKGVYLSPSQYEVNFLSVRHKKAVLNKAAGIINKAYLGCLHGG